MKKTSAIILAGALLLTGCGSKAVSQSESGSVSTSGGSDSAAHSDDVVITLGWANGQTYDWGIGTTAENSMKHFIDEFNAKDNGVRVEVKIFSELEEFRNYGYDDKGTYQGYSDEECRQMDFFIAQELINKDSIDIIAKNSFCAPAKYEIFKRKGAFADLYKFMEDDPEVNRDTLNSHILDLCEYEGKLYSIPSYYMVNTMIGKSEYVGTKQNWTIDEFIDRWNAMPSGSMVNHSLTAEYIYYDVLRANTSAFIDYNNFETHFDHPDFHKMLVFCKGFESNMGQKLEGAYDQSRPNLVELYRIWGYNGAIYEDVDYANNTVDYPHILDGEMTLVGFPTSDGRGAYLSGGSFGDISIRANTSEEKQEAAWKFIREFYLEEFQLENFAQANEYTDHENGQPAKTWTILNGFPINNAARKTTAERFMSGYYDNVNNTLSVQNKVCKDNLTQADIDFIDDYVNSIDRWGAGSDRELFNIVEGEVLAYLKGGQDIDTTVDVIQSRASIWISEQA